MILNLISKPKTRVVCMALLFFTAFAAKAQDNLEEVRQRYYAGVDDEAQAESFLEWMQKQDQDVPIYRAYLGGAEAIQAKHAWNPYNKMKYLKQGSETLEEAVQMQPQNIEIRFIRFTMEHYVPSFLGYSTHLEADKKMILQNLTNYGRYGLDAAIAQKIKQFLLDSGRCTTQEEQKLINLAL